MMHDDNHAMTIVIMATVSYMTRIGDYIFLRNRTLSPRAQMLLESAPGCVLISVIAPEFFTGKPADMIALALTIAAATRFPMLVTVVVAIASAGLLRHLIG